MPTVLVVDDSPIDRRLTERLLQRSPQLAVEFAVHGQAALDKLAAVPVDLVVTDMQMPELDGLALVEAIRTRYPLVPVVLMTAHGSEEIAVQALLRGAAGYVPKAELARDLLTTVENVLATARANRRHQRLLDSIRYHDLRFELESDPELVAPLVDLIQQVLISVGLVDDTGRVRVAIAVEEALLNGMLHGNLELASTELAAAEAASPGGQDALVRQRAAQPALASRRLDVRVTIDSQQCVISIRDQGQGFDPLLVPDPADPVNLTRESGRGLLLMRMFMDEVRFNDRGNEVTLVKRRGR